MKKKKKEEKELKVNLWDKLVYCWSLKPLVSWSLSILCAAALKREDQRALDFSLLQSCLPIKSFLEWTLEIRNKQQEVIILFTNLFVFFSKLVLKMTFHLLSVTIVTNFLWLLLSFFNAQFLLCTYLYHSSPETWLGLGVLAYFVCTVLFIWSSTVGNAFCGFLLPGKASSEVGSHLAWMRWENMAQLH